MLCLCLCSCTVHSTTELNDADFVTGITTNDSSDTAPDVTPMSDVSLPGASSPTIDSQLNEGDISSDTQAQINALEQSSTVRDDDVAPVEASAYCKLTVSCEVLLSQQDQLNDVLLPPDGMFYSGTVVLNSDETALQLVADKLAACGLICELEGDIFHQIAAIPNDLVDGMRWVLFCNNQPLNTPAEYIIQSGDVLLLGYVADE